MDAFGISGGILFYWTTVQGNKECLKVSVLHWDVGILLEVLVWNACVDLWIKGYLCCKTIFCNKVALNVYLMNFFICRKNFSFMRYLDFCVFSKSADFKICYVIKIISITT